MAGNLRFELTYPGLGPTEALCKIRRSSGTKDRKLFDRYVEMLDDLYHGRNPNHDQLRLIRDGKVSAAELYDRMKAGTLHLTPDLLTKKLAKPAIDQYLIEAVAKETLAANTKKSYQYKVNAFFVAVGKLTIAELPVALTSYRDSQRTNKRQFQYVKDIISGFLKESLGKRHQVYKDWLDVDTLGYKRPKEAGNPQPIYVLLKIRDNLPESHQASFMAMCFSGMMPSEFFPNKWAVEQEIFQNQELQYLHIYGEKTEYRNRLVPLLIQPQIFLTSNNWFGEVLKNATENGKLTGNQEFTPYDCRRSFELMMDNAGIPKNRQALYMGHSPKTQTEDYGVHNVKPYLMDDHAKLLDHIKREKQPPKNGNPLQEKTLAEMGLPVLEDGTPKIWIKTVGDIIGKGPRKRKGKTTITATPGTYRRSEEEAAEEALRFREKHGISESDIIDID